MGYAGVILYVKDPSNPYWHEAVGGSVPHYLFIQFPDDRYAPGKMISKHVFGYDSNMKPLKLILTLPTGKTIEF